MGWAVTKSRIIVVAASHTYFAQWCEGLGFDPRSPTWIFVGAGDATGVRRLRDLDRAGLVYAHANRLGPVHPEIVEHIRMLQQSERIVPICHTKTVLWPDVEAIDAECWELSGHEPPHVDPNMGSWCNHLLYRIRGEGVL